MDIGYDGVLVRDVDSLRPTTAFADIVDNAYLGLDYDEAGFPYPLVLHFDGDLTAAEQSAVIQRLQSTPAQEQMRNSARSAITANNTFLAIASPTNVDIVQQVKRLTRECNALIKMVLGGADMTDTTGT